MKMTKPRMIAAGLVVGLGAVAGMTSMGVSQQAGPEVAQRDSTTVGKGAPESKAAPENKNAAAPDAKSDNAGKSDRADRRQDRADRTYDRADRDVIVDAPNAKVGVQKDTGRVAVNAPGTKVRVDPERGQVRVRAPYVDLNIRW